VKGTGNERAVTADISQSFQILHVPYSTAGEQGDRRHHSPDSRYQRMVKARVGSDPCQVQDQHRLHAGSDSRIGKILGRPVRTRAQVRANGQPIPQVQTEDDALAANVLADLIERCERRQRFEPDDDGMSTEAQSMASSRTCGHSRIDQRVHPSRKTANHGILHRLACYRVEVSDIQFGQAELLPVGIGQGRCVARLDSHRSGRAHRLIVISPSATGVNSQALAQVDHANYTHEVPAP
jgi:hypothetical protein